MKTRSGCERRGRNNIQAGPWDGQVGEGLYGAGGYAGMFGGGTRVPFGGAAYGDGEGSESDEEVGAYGFTHEEEMELLSQGVKPWEDDAGAVLAALSGDYDDY